MREEDTESFAAVELDGLSSSTDIDMLIVDILSTTTEPAGCWFHHKKATPPEKSGPHILDCIVLQRSVLGPLMFIS